MVPESQYCQVKARMPEIKQLFQARRYVQCATLCERLLNRNHDEVHPVHRAYLHFYFALVHDTMARETSLRQRSAELDLAEQNYRAAIDILSPNEPYNLDDILSPASTGSEDAPSTRYRRRSDDSYGSAASSATSVNEDEAGAWAVGTKSRNGSDPCPTASTTGFNCTKRRPTPIMAINASRAHLEEQFSADLSSFITMVQKHLRNVQELKADPPVARFSLSRSSSSTLSSRPVSRDSVDSSGNEMQQLRWARKSVNFRPRFDPSGVRKLCNEALSEL